METPSSARRITRSQAKAVTNTDNSHTKFSRKIEDPEKSNVTKSKQRTEQQDRCPLLDISNDSPIVGLASATPVSSLSKSRSKKSFKQTPGSGEALLRGQVKNLLQKVEEEAEMSKFILQSCGPLRHGFKAMFNSPAALVAPTPVNTPQVLNFSAIEESDSWSSVSEPAIEDQLTLPQVINGTIDDKKQTETSPEPDNGLMISRTLFLEFSEKSDSSSDCSSVVTYQETTGKESEEKMASMEEDDSSIWSIQANASTRDEDDDEDELNQDYVEDDDETGVDNEEYYDEAREDEDGILDLDELCEGISNISMDCEKKGPKFMGKHIRFVYNSDDELVEECEEGDENADCLRLKGLPTPKGKHVRFQDEEGEEEDLL